MTAMFSLPRIALPLLATTLTASASTATSTVVVEGAQGRQGAVRAVMFRDTAGWLKPDSVVRINIAALDSVSGGNVTFMYADLLTGCYVLLVFRDASNDGKPGTSPAGIPIEPYGFSRDACGRSGPSALDDAATGVQDDQCVTIHLH